MKNHSGRNGCLIVLGIFILLIVVVTLANVGSKSAAPKSGGSVVESMSPFTTSTTSTLPTSSSQYMPLNESEQLSYAPPAGDRWTFAVETTGPGLTSVTYMKPGFNIAQDTSPKGKKWVFEIQADYGFGQPNLNAQNKGAGKITCKISKNGETVTENSSTGPYAVVMCM